jgi:mono/diheme cytochrome c family protein
MHRSLIAATCSVFALQLTFGAIEIPGDARQGEQVFKSQRCVECHSVNGVGGKSAPDLGKRTARNYTPAIMASLMWNHAPKMWSAMSDQAVTRPQLTSEQAADLFAFFYASRYFERPGDAGRGRQAFQAKGCAGCHALSGVAGSGPKAVASWKSLNDPILLAQEMWNHAALMKEALGKKQIAWPRLTSQELTDMLVYLQNLPETRGRQTEFAPASAETGKMLFDLKGCKNCHTGKQSLENRFANRTVVDFAVAMWNHAPKMAQPAPELRAEEMRRIAGYLWSIQLFDSPGNAARGKSVYQAKNCATCHEDASSGAPKIVVRDGVSSPLKMVHELWRHGPAMLEVMKKKNIAWPQFAGHEMADLIAYLNSSGS